MKSPLDGKECAAFALRLTAGLLSCIVLTLCPGLVHCFHSNFFSMTLTWLVLGKFEYFDIRVWCRLH